MRLPRWLDTQQRRPPSANVTLLCGDQPILVDTGYSTQVSATTDLLRRHDVLPSELLVVLTHTHSDHSGAAGSLAAQGANIAAHGWEAASVNHRDSDAASALWLDQPLPPFRVHRALARGDRLRTGRAEFHVLHTPGHTLGHIALWEPDERVLICGDAVHADDVPWLAPMREGAGALRLAITSLELFADLSPRTLVSGHGAISSDPPATLERALARLRTWYNAPERLATHAAKRILIHRLMLAPIPTADLRAYLDGCDWVRDYAAMLAATPGEFAEDLISRLTRTGALAERAGMVIATGDHAPPTPLDWSTVDPRSWTDQPGP